MRLKNRRGAFAIITAIVFMSMVMVGAVAVDFSRLWTLKNEMQTAADAGAHAGAIELMPSRYTNATAVTNVVTLYATNNKAMTATPAIDSLTLGNWDQPSRTFTPGGAPQNAVKVVTAYNMSGLIMSAFGVPPVRMRARAVGWSQAPVINSGCMKPWAIPYENLMFAINNFRGIANTNANLNRPFDQVADIAALNAMTPAQRTFNLKNGSQSSGQNTITQAGATSSSMPGNYQAVRLGKLWDAATSQYANPGPNTGGQAYRYNIEGVDQSGNPVCHSLAVGDSLQTETGNKIGPTVQSVDGPICQPIPSNQTLATFGDCFDTSGGNPEIKAAFFACGSGCTGQSTVAVKMLGSFKMTKMYPANCGPNALPSLGQCSTSEMVGVFQPIQSSGPSGGGATTLQKPIIAQ